MCIRNRVFAMLVVGCVLLASVLAGAQDQQGDEVPVYLRDRGTGVTTSLFGTYVRKGQWLVYPFYEYEKKSAEEYHGSEIGYAGETDYMGESELHQVLLFIGYGVTDDVALELEFALYETATLNRASDDMTSGMPKQIEESGFGEIETQVRWRIVKETASRPEVFTFMEIGYPLQKDKVLIGVQDWEAGVGLGLVKGFDWGTLTPRISIEYEGEDDEILFGEWALEYLKKLSDSWRVVATIEGEEDEISIIGEVQWRFMSNAFLKLNCGFGLMEEAPDIAPEVGVMFEL